MSDVNLKISKGRFNPDIIKEAVEKVLKDNLSLWRVAGTYTVPKTTLNNRISAAK